MAINIRIRLVGILGLIAIGLIILSNLVIEATPPLNYIAFGVIIIAIFWALYEAFELPGPNR